MEPRAHSSYVVSGTCLWVSELTGKTDSCGRGRKEESVGLCWELGVHISMIKGCIKNTLQSDDFNNHPLFFLRYFCSSFQDPPPVPFSPLRQKSSTAVTSQPGSSAFLSCTTTVCLSHPFGTIKKSFQELSPVFMCVTIFQASTQSPALLPSGIYSTLLKDPICSPQLGSLVSHFWPSPSPRIWALASKAKKSSEEKGTLPMGSWVWCCWSSVYHGKQDDSQGPAEPRAASGSIHQTFLMLPSFLFLFWWEKKRKCRGKKEVTNQECNWMKMRLK